MKLWGKTQAELADERRAMIAEREAIAMRDQLYRERPSTPQELGRRYALPIVSKPDHRIPWLIAASVVAVLMILAVTAVVILS